MPSSSNDRGVRPGSTSSASTPLSLCAPSLRNRFTARSSLRKPSTPSLSLIFAQGDATPAAPPSKTPTSAGGRAVLASEDALSRQLVNDSGGTRMGLRSRTGSEATVNSIHSVMAGGDGSGSGTGKGKVSGARGSRGMSRLGSPVEGEGEEEAGDHALGSPRPRSSETSAASGDMRLEAEAGPSTLRTHRPSLPLAEHLSSSPTEHTHSLHPTVSRASHGTVTTGDAGSVRSGRTINPKKSSSWLKWNQPVPQFPRSRAGSMMQDDDHGPGVGGADGMGKGKGKGKERAHAHTDGITASAGQAETVGIASASGRAGTGTSVELSTGDEARTPRPLPSQSGGRNDSTARGHSEAEPPPDTRGLPHSSPSGLSAGSGSSVVADADGTTASVGVSGRDTTTRAAIAGTSTNTGTGAGTGLAPRTGWRALIWGSGVPIPDGLPASAPGSTDEASGAGAVTGADADADGNAGTSGIGVERVQTDAGSAPNEQDPEVALKTTSAEAGSEPAGKVGRALGVDPASNAVASDHDGGSTVPKAPLTGSQARENGATAPASSVQTDRQAVRDVSDPSATTAPVALVDEPEHAQVPSVGWGGYLYSYISRTSSAPAPAAASGPGAALAPTLSATAVGTETGSSAGAGVPVVPAATGGGPASASLSAQANGIAQIGKAGAGAGVDVEVEPAKEQRPATASVPAPAPVSVSGPGSGPVPANPHILTTDARSGTQLSTTTVSTAAGVAPTTTTTTVTQPSTPQAQGWLSFLARRAAQRTIKGPSSSLDGRKSVDVDVDADGEEVGETMDFSDDPYFPTSTVGTNGTQRAELDSGADTRGSKKGDGKAIVPTPSTAAGAAAPTATGGSSVVPKKSAGALTIRNKRLSISSNSGRGGGGGGGGGVSGSLGSSPLATSPRAISTIQSADAKGAANGSKDSVKTASDAPASAQTVTAVSGKVPPNVSVNGPAKASPASSVRSMPAAVPSLTQTATASPPRHTATAAPTATNGKVSMPSGSAPPMPLTLKPPNVITPSFDDTFHRPPRSLLPLDEEREQGPGGRNGQNAGKNAQGQDAQGTMGKLAWRAFSAASSYVYGASQTAGGTTPIATAPGAATVTNHAASKAGGKGHRPSDPTTGEAEGKGDDGRGSECVQEAPQPETRGLASGRAVGSGLPRLIGLRSEPADSGYASVRRVVVVGVHGWFPAKMLNSVIGEPTGTSVKFASMMSNAVKDFFRERGVEEAEMRVTSMPLEGEGTIEHRVDRLYKAYLSNPAWINDLRRADAIFFAAHSQGCIVTTHLISRMIAQGHIRTPHNADAVARCEWAFGPIGVVPSPPSSTFRVPDKNSGAKGRRSAVASKGSGTTTAGSKNSASTVAPHVSDNPLDGILGSDGGYQKVCLLDMCGVHLGPLYSISTSSVIQPYLQWFENAAARELFEFQDSASAVSVEYTKALGMVLENGVKVVLLASLNDQVVPIYGASFSTASHPLLLRALFVDGASFTSSDFMIRLLDFAFMLRNAGLDDQRLVEHLSEATAGSLTGLGHSTPYEEPASYALAVSYLFHSGPARAPLPALHVEPFSAREARNDFELPWIMRALVDSDEVKDLFPQELAELKEGVLAWKPVTKVLKEMKKRLEPMAGRQSKLRQSINSSGSGVADGAANGHAAHVPGLKRDW